MLAEAAEEAARAREQEEAHAAAKAAAEAALQDAKEQAERAATEHQEQIKVLEARVLELQESHDREMAMRIKDEAERTLEKVEELWRTSADNAKLKAENETYRQDKARSEVEAGILAEAFRAMEADSQSLIVDAAEAQLAVVQLESALASFNRHAQARFRAGAKPTLAEHARAARARAPLHRRGRALSHLSLRTALAVAARVSRGSRCRRFGRPDGRL